MFINPADSGSEKMGLNMGTINKLNLLCEDAVVFDQPLIYSIRSKTQLLAWRCPLLTAQYQLPSEVQHELRVASMNKYRWLFERLNRIEVQLKEIGNFGTLLLSKAVEQKAALNFPHSNIRVA